MAKVVSDVIKEEMDVLIADITQRMEDTGKVVSGRTRDSLEAIINGMSGELWGAGYSGALEFGRSGGAIPYNFKDIIKEWIIAKGLSFSDEKELDRWAGAIAWTIRRDGTSMHRSGAVEDIFETPIDEFYTRLSAKLGALYTEQVQNEIFNFK